MCGFLNTLSDFNTFRYWCSRVIWGFNTEKQRRRRGR